MLALETNRIPLLERFLELCQIDCKGKSLDSVTIKLQDSEDESTPDAAIIESNGHKTLFIESKLRGSVGSSQLVSHVRSGKGSVPVVCVSRGKVEPPEIEEARRNLTQQGFDKTLIRWIGWQQIYMELGRFTYDRPGKPEVEGLKESIERENMSNPTFRGFKKSELVETSQFAKTYAAIFQNAKQLIEDVIEYVQEKDENVEVSYSRRPSTTSPIMQKVSAGFRYAEMQLYYATVSFDFSKGHVHQSWELLANQLKALNRLQIENILADLHKEGFKLEGYSEGNLEEVSDLETLSKLHDEVGVAFSRYYCFSDDALYTNPQDLVRSLGDGILWMLDFFKKRGLYVSE